MLSGLNLSDLLSHLLPHRCRLHQLLQQVLILSEIAIVAGHHIERLDRVEMVPANK